MEQHQILEDLTEHGYVGIDPSIKVRKLLNGIRMDKLDSVKASILALSGLRSDFNAYVSLYRDFISQSASLHDKATSLHIGALGTDTYSRKKKRGRDGGG